MGGFQFSRDFVYNLIMPSLTVKQLLDMNQPLQAVALSKIDAVTAYRVGRILAVLQDPIQAAVTSHDKLVKKHGVPAADGKVISVPEEKMVDFMAEFTLLLAVAEEFTFSPLPVSALAAEKISPADMMRLAPILTDDAG
mgnify:CR=1 FL=1